MKQKRWIREKKEKKDKDTKEGQVDDPVAPIKSAILSEAVSF